MLNYMVLLDVKTRRENPFVLSVAMSDVKTMFLHEKEGVNRADFQGRKKGGGRTRV